MSSLLDVDNLRIRRGGVQVLDLHRFSVAAEEKVAVVGPNGAGKSSLLMGIACLLRRESGTITFNGEPVTERDETAYRRKIAMVFQEPLLFDTTVIDNVAEGLRIRGTGRCEARDIARDSLELFKVGHLSNRSAHKLSGGEAQRVSLARAFAVRPELLLMDEPFSSLDLPTRIALAEDLGRILHESGTAAIIATHDRIEAFHVVERLVVMDGGKIVQEGTPAEVMAEPANTFVAAFRRTTGTLCNTGKENIRV
ncbi:MAG: ABC transporter ATP-binding protein [Desulfuromonadaceae bacterium]|nr:ABC transporter ATP-binding protein [Desulfuromonadaceae bacterium]MDD5107436.1 ABC transporter ATP-binding protein [Desulfuromonadaceae bacterium]